MTIYKVCFLYKPTKTRKHLITTADRNCSLLY